VLDELDLHHTKLVIEPWPNSFFYKPEAILEFLESVDHPQVALHLDQMNMVGQDTYYETTALVNTTFDLLAGHIGGVHFKDVFWDWSHMLLKFDEVLIITDRADENLLLSSRNLPNVLVLEARNADPVNAMNFSRLHELARGLGFEFERRVPSKDLVR
jgi:hypothetical protein